MAAEGFVMSNFRMPCCMNITRVIGLLLGLSVFWTAELMAQTSSQRSENETRGAESEHRSILPGDLVVRVVAEYRNVGIAHQCSDIF